MVFQINAGPLKVGRKENENEEENEKKEGKGGGGLQDFQIS